MHSASWAFVVTALQAFLDTFVTEAMATIWDNFCVITQIQAYRTSKFLFNKLLEPFKHVGGGNHGVGDTGGHPAIDRETAAN